MEFFFWGISWSVSSSSNWGVLSVWLHCIWLTQGEWWSGLVVTFVFSSWERNVFGLVLISNLVLRFGRCLLAFVIVSSLLSVDDSHFRCSLLLIQGFRLPERERRCSASNETVLQLGGPSFPIPRSVDRLSPRWDARLAQDPYLYGKSFPELSLPVLCPVLFSFQQCINFFCALWRLLQMEKLQCLCTKGKRASENFTVGQSVRVKYVLNRWGLDFWFMCFSLLFFFISSCSDHISFCIATSERNHGFGGQETEGRVQREIQKKGRVGTRKILWNRQRKRRRVWDLHGSEQQVCSAQLQPFDVFEMLPRLVSFSRGKTTSFKIHIFEKLS